MPIPLLNSVISWLLKKRIQQVELFMKYPEETQLECLMNLLKSAKDTQFGKKYDFQSIIDYSDFSKRIPVVTYEDIADDISRMRHGEQNLFWPTPIKWFAQSSGTTNAKSKYIPVSQESLEDCHYAAAKDLLCMYLNNNPESKLFDGKGLRLGGSKRLLENGGTQYGDLSSILIDNMPFWADYSSTPTAEVALMEDWELKLPAITQEALKENVTSLAGVPSWMLVLLNHILKTSGKENIAEIWPNLEVFFHGGVNFDPYQKPFRSIINLPEMKFYEIYNASEGFFAIQDSNDEKELLLMLDYGIFYEFIPMSDYGKSDARIIPLWEVEKDVNYALIISTNAGLWRYNIGDTLRFTSIKPYRIKVTGRTKHFINAFGEELIIENAENALKVAAQRTDAVVKDYTAAPIFMDGKSKGAHQWLIEFEKKPASLQAFAEALDRELQQLNSDYEAKRKNNTTLNQLKIVEARKDLFYDWLKKHQKLGGQHKVPRLANNRELIEELLSMNLD